MIGKSTPQCLFTTDDGRMYEIDCNTAYVVDKKRAHYLVIFKDGKIFDFSDKTSQDAMFSYIIRNYKPLESTKV